MMVEKSAPETGDSGGATSNTKAKPVVDKEEKKAKRQRKRKRQKYQDIARQMSFYFSDANLSKDRYMKELYQKADRDGFIDLKEFLNFNKIRALAEDDVDFLANALEAVLLETGGSSKSQSAHDGQKVTCSDSKDEVSQITVKTVTEPRLALSEDKTKIKRLTPFVSPDQSDVDARTAYIEVLPKKTTHEILKKYLQEHLKCGTVVYISLPKFKTTGDSRGFAFVEFSDAQEVAKACELMPKRSRPVGLFPKKNKQVECLQKKLSLESDTPVDTPYPALPLTENAALMAQTHSPVNIPPPQRKRRISLCTDTPASNVPPGVKPPKAPTLQAHHHQSPLKQRHSSASSVSNAAMATSVTPSNRGDSLETCGLVAIPKNEWQTARDDFLKTQKANVSAMKAKVGAHRKSARTHIKFTDDDYYNDSENVTMETPKNDGEKKVDAKPTSPAAATPYPLNCLVKASAPDIILSKLYLKDAFLANPPAFIDVNSMNTAILRFKSEPEAKMAIGNALKHDADLGVNVSFTTLTGPEESEYWSKVSSDRNRKAEKKKRNQMRHKFF